MYVALLTILNMVLRKGVEFRLQSGIAQLRYLLERFINIANDSPYAMARVELNSMQAKLCISVRRSPLRSVSSSTPPVG